MTSVLQRLAVGQEATFEVDAACPANPSSIQLETGARYDLRSTVRSEWRDAWIKSSLSTGWGCPASWFERLARGRARAPQFPMYSLVGTIGDGSCFFLIGEHSDLVAPTTGELIAFANDWPTRYGNNHGLAEVSVRRL